MDPVRFETDAQQHAARLTALLDMGFECIEQPATTESVALECGRTQLSQSLPAMGTIVTITVVHASAGLAEDGMGAAFDAMHSLIGTLNRFEAGSAMATLNDRGGLADAPDELMLLLHRAAGLHRLSGGAFDITVQPLVDLLRDRRVQGLEGAPRPDQVEAALQRVDGRAVKLDGRAIELVRDGMGVTLDGIAKGYIVDRMAATLRRRGIRDFLVNAGGDIRTGGTNGDGMPWRVAVQDPDKGGEFPDVVAMDNGAIATSGSYEIFFNREQTLHHLVRAGCGGLLESRSVSVRAPSALQADALATAVFVMGPARGLRLLESIPGCECLIVTRDDEQLRSRGWSRAVLHRQES